MSLTEGMALLLALTLVGTILTLVIALRERASRVMAMAWSWLPPVRRARRLAADLAYEQWKRKGGGAWLDSWWDTPEAACPPLEKATAARPAVRGRMSIKAVQRKLAALLELTVARGATPAEAATARAIAERLKADYDLH